MDTAAVKTRLLVISDTHGMDLNLADIRADVAIHCGDLTNRSKLNEFRTTINILKGIDAPLKLAIAGNHDFTLDDVTFERKIAKGLKPFGLKLVPEESGTIGGARKYSKTPRRQVSYCWTKALTTSPFKMGRGWPFMQVPTPQEIGGVFNFTAG
jgi:predicted MPP superfamily phosphohydrolase